MMSYYDGMPYLVPTIKNWRERSLLLAHNNPCYSPAFKEAQTDTKGQSSF